MFGKYKKIAVVLVLAVTLVMSGCTGDKGSSVYAVVNGTEITQEDYDLYVNFLWFNPEVELTQEQEMQVMDEMIQLEVYVAEAKERGLVPDRDAAQTEFESFRDQIINGELFGGNTTMYYARAQELGLSEAWMIEVFERFQLINKMVQDEEEKAVEPSDEEIETFYEEEKDNLFAHGELRRVRHILINAKNFPEADEDELDALTESLAQDIYDRLVAGEEYADLAPEYSQDGSAEVGGDIGLIEKSDVVKEFGEVAFSIEPGIIAEPVLSEFGWHILEVTEIQESGHYELDDNIRDWISSNLYDQDAKNRVDNLLTGLMDEADITNNME